MRAWIVVRQQELRQVAAYCNAYEVLRQMRRVRAKGALRQAAVIQKYQHDLLN